MNSPVLKVKDLKRYYPGVKAVDGIDLTVEKGTCFSILGPNGAGKTTTVEILAGLRNRDSGSIEYFGKNINMINRDIKQRIGVQLQSTNFLENLTVVETIDFFSGLFEKSVSADELINTVSLIEKKRNRVKELSGGQLQRLAVAVALVNDPEIVFLDEPTTGLDPQARRMLWQTIKKMKEKGKTLILTTHYMEEAEELSDKVIIIDHGKVIASGTVRELINSIEHDNIVEFNLSENKSDLSINILKERFSGLKLLDKMRYSITTTDVEKTLIKLFDIAKENKFMLNDIVIRKPNLEDVFLTLTGHSLRD
ncbi:MAG: ABC transporter ATP-binding protein [Kosmotogaceae bacterium]